MVSNGLLIQLITGVWVGSGGMLCVMGNLNGARGCVSGGLQFECMSQF